MKKLFIYLFSILVLSNVFSVTIYSQKVPAVNKYVIHIKACDWGPVTDYVYFNTGKFFKTEQIKKEDFDVSTVYLIDEKMDARFLTRKGKRNIIAANLCDEFGNITSEKSRYVRLDFEYGPDVENCNPFNQNILLNQATVDIFGYRVVNKRLKISTSRLSGVVNEQAGQFVIHDFEEDNHILKYASWETKNKEEGAALIIWLHGIAEGGKNPYLPLFGIKSTNLITDEIQQYFEKGANIIVPQCPTSWLETTSVDIFGLKMWEPIDIEGAVNKVTDPITNVLKKIVPDEDYILNDETPYASVSYYSNVLKGIIESYLNDNSYIDRNKIYIGGCSAGGYMTLNMLLQFPDFFAAAIPASEIYVDNKITDNQIKELTKVPLWFVHSIDDSVVNYATYDMATVDRLKEAGHKNLIYTLYDDVRDTSGKYFDKEGNPYKYSGHYSWIYVLNNEPKENEMTIFEWLSKQKRN